MNKSSLIYGLFSLALIWCLYGDVGRGLASYLTSTNNISVQEMGSWGDSFGAFNAFFGSVGFVGAVFTLYSQGKAIRQQRIDIAEEKKDQHKRQFEASFFQLLGLMREIRSEISYKYSALYVTTTGRIPTKTAKGSEALARAAREIAFWIVERERLGIKHTSSGLGRLYETKVHRRYEAKLGPYYRIIYTILRKIHDDKILSHQDKVSYGNILRSQLQSREVLLLAINGMTEMANNFSDYLSYFRIMKYLPSDKMKKRLLVGYPEYAFEARD